MPASRPTGTRARTPCQSRMQPKTNPSGSTEYLIWSATPTAAIATAPHGNNRPRRSTTPQDRACGDHISAL